MADDLRSRFISGGGVSESDESKKRSTRDDGRTSLRDMNVTFGSSSSSRKSEEQPVNTINIGLSQDETGKTVVVQPTSTSTIKRVSGQNVNQSLFRTGDKTVISENGGVVFASQDFGGGTNLSRNFRGRAPVNQLNTFIVDDPVNRESRRVSAFELGAANFFSTSRGTEFNFARAPVRDSKRSVTPKQPDLFNSQGFVDPLFAQGVESGKQKKIDITSNKSFTPDGAIGIADTRSTRRGRFFEQFIGSPGQAFTAPFADVTRFVSGGESQRESSRFLASGTPLESTAALFGSIGLFAAPGRVPVGKAEAAVLKGAGTGVGSGALRFAGGLSIAGLEGRIISTATSRRLTRSAPEEFQPFLNQDQTFRTARAAETQAESSFLRNALGGINPNLNRRNINVFRESAREQLIEQGLRGEELETGVEALTFRRTTIDPGASALVTLNAGRFSEILGRTNVAAGVSRRPQILNQGFAGRGLSIGRRIAPAGVAEVRGEIAGTRARQGTDLPFFEGPRSLLPEISTQNGFSVRSRSQVGQDVGLGLFGAGVSGVLGGVVGAGATAPRGVRGSAARGTGRTANIIGNIADPTEPITDFLAGSAGQGSFRTVVPTLGAENIALNIGGRGSTPSISEGSGFARAPNTPITPPSFTVPFNVPTISPVVTPSSVPVSPDTRRGGRGVSAPVPPVIPPLIPSQVPSDVPAQVPVTPTTPVNPFVNVPVNSFVGRIPPPVPLNLNLGRGGGSGRGGGTIFVNELAGALSFASSSLSSPAPAPRSVPKSNGKKKSKKKKKKEDQPFNIFGESDNPFNIFGGGVRFV